MNTSLNGDDKAVQVASLLSLIREMSTAHRDAKNLYLDRLAPDYNVFDFIEPDEMRLSKIIAWLLNPDQTHGQGSLFLRLFCELTGTPIEPEHYARAEVRTEVAIKDGRLDVLVSTPGLRLAIENKPWAGDQDSQLQRYFAFFNSFGTSLYRVIYLTPKGTEPPEQSIPETDRKRRIEVRQLQLWSYTEQVLDWLTRCRAECRADRVSIFIDEFSRYIRTVFAGMKDRTMSDHLVDEIVGSAERVSAAMQVIALSDTIRQRLLSSLKEQLTKKLPGRLIELNDDPWARYSGLTITATVESSCQFVMEFQGTQFNDLVIGVSPRSKKNLAQVGEYEALHKALVDNFGTASQNDNWIWYRSASAADPLLPVVRHWSTATEPWVDIVTGELASSIADAFGRVHSVLSECRSDRQ
jgi:hypothetical protein